MAAIKHVVPEIGRPRWRTNEHDVELGAMLTSPFSVSEAKS